MTKRFRTVIFLLTVFKIHEHFLNLMEDIVFRFETGSHGILCVANRISEVRNHEKLLIETVHIADTT